jgi:hypothetical protein
VVAGIERQFAKYVVMEAKERLGFGAGAHVLAVRQELRDGQQAIRDTLHRRDDHDDLRCLRYRPDQAGGVKHSLGTEQRSAAELKGDNCFAIAG